MQARLPQAQLGAIGRRLLRRPIGQLHLQLGAEGDHLRPLGRGHLPHRPRQLPSLWEIVLAHVGHEEARLGRQEVQLPQQPRLLLRQRQRAHHPAALQVPVHPLQQLQLLLVVLGTPLGRPTHLLQAPLHSGQVGQGQLQIHHLDVLPRVQLRADVGDVGVAEAADDHGDGVHIADVAQEFVPQPLAAMGAAHQAGDVHELGGGGHHPLRLHQGSDVPQPPVGHLGHAHVAVKGGEGIFGHGGVSFGEGVEKG